MNKTSAALFAIPALMLIMFSSSALVNDAMAEENGKIPGWVKGVFGFYADGDIDDDELIEGLQFLIKSDIIVVESEGEQTKSSIDASKIQNENDQLVSDNRQLRQKVATLEDERRIFLGPYDSLDEFVKAQEEIATKNGLLLVEKSREVSEYKQRAEYYEELFHDFSSRWEKSQAVISDLEYQIEKLKEEIEELKNQ